jgi:tol-pal system protein YbgF
VAAGAGQGAAPGGAEAQAGEGTLGVVPQSALLGLPRPEPGTVATPPRTTNLPPQQQYDAAMQLLRAGDYAGAEGGLQLFLDLNPEHALAPNAAYWLAETHYVRKSYAAAAAAFARNYRVYGKDDTKAPDNLLKLGMSLEGLQETDKACRTFAELAKEFPNAPAHIQQALVRERERAECA